MHLLTQQGKGCISGSSSWSCGSGEAMVVSQGDPWQAVIA